MNEREPENKADGESVSAPSPERESAEQSAPEQHTDVQEVTNEEHDPTVTMFRRPKRLGKYISKLEQSELDKLQRKKSMFMYLSTLFFGVTLLLKVEGREKLAQQKSLFALFSLYVICLLVMIVFSVYIAVLGGTSQKIGREIKEKNTPLAGLDKRTFTSYEIFNGFHVVLALAEVAISIYGFGVWGAVNIAAAVASAACSIISRQILFKANSGNLEYFPAREESEQLPNLITKNKSKRKKHR